MVDPLLALSVFGILALLALAFFWPRRGGLARLREYLEMTQRVRLEDALKHLYKCEYGGRACSVNSLAGAMEIPRPQALHLLGQLEELKLARAEAEAFELSEEGREYALHIVRTHRLLERYLADRTGIEPTEWHQEAERREHAFSPSDTEDLSARLGHPRYDPHGDPIPTAQGELPPLSGVPLTTLQAGDVASVIHLGDEPKEVFQALSQVGLSPQMPVRLLQTDPGEVRFEAGGKTHSLPPVVARSITVVPLSGAEFQPGREETLADGETGEELRVVGIHPALQGPQRRRLLDLGLVPGTVVEVELRSPGGDPTAYRVRGALIALRRNQARWILVDREALREVS